MSSSSETSVVASSNRGVPSKCNCGAGVRIFTLRTEENPGRPFFYCFTKRDPSSWTNKRDGHLFKWVEEAVYEEVEDALPKLGLMANEIVKTNSQVNELTAALLELKEEALWRKVEIRKFRTLLKSIQTMDSSLLVLVHAVELQELPTVLMPSSVLKPSSVLTPSSVRVQLRDPPTDGCEAGP
ncbi:PREDICTED: uncharacterized protein At1g43920, Chloroplastic-like [Camelina sativa]|uniref:Uncharacterized protein At1g43920, Chloroplastic-like n=1 Tax=Camelina sativa TaxID=90675 RepID=A0ABM1R028_CAMSA|nr:PREDICTED: uncharacterized protein At1g43920, Chloroplastic-like [Camelina sativa]